MQRQNLQQLRPALQTRRDETIHPSHGIGNPYSQDMRSLVMFMSEHLNDQDENPHVVNMVALLRQAHVYCTLCYRKICSLFDATFHQNQMKNESDKHIISASMRWVL